MLDLERKFYTANLERWLRESPGKTVLIKGQALIGIYDNPELALAAGASNFGLESFPVRTIGQKDEDIIIPALTLGLLSASNQRPAGG